MWQSIKLFFSSLELKDYIYLSFMALMFSIMMGSYYSINFMNKKATKIQQTSITSQEKKILDSLFLYDDNIFSLPLSSACTFFNDSFVLKSYSKDFPEHGRSICTQEISTHLDMDFSYEVIWKEKTILGFRFVFDKLQPKNSINYKILQNIVEKNLNTTLVDSKLDNWLKNDNFKEESFKIGHYNYQIIDNELTFEIVFY